MNSYFSFKIKSFDRKIHCTNPLPTHSVFYSIFKIKPPCIEYDLRLAINHSLEYYLIKPGD